MRGTPSARAAALGLALLAAPPAAAWTCYGSERYGTSAEAPDGYVARRPPDDGDGRELVSPDGRARIAVFAMQDVLGEGMAPPADMTVTYRAHGPGWAVYSGTRGGRIVYERMLSPCRPPWLIHHVAIEYDGADAGRMAAIVPHVAGSLRGTCPR